MVLRKHGNKDAAKLIKKIAQSTPTRGQKIRKAWINYKREIKPTQLSTDEEIAL
jgi:hypothetical protein